MASSQIFELSKTLYLLSFSLALMLAAVADGGGDEQTYMMEMKSKDEIIKEFLASAKVNTLDELDVFLGWLSFMS